MISCGRFNEESDRIRSGELAPRDHSITSSALCWRNQGTSKPSVISRCTPKLIVHVISIGQQAAEFSEEAGRIDGRETIASRQRYDLNAHYSETCGRFRGILSLR